MSNVRSVHGASNCEQRTVVKPPASDQAFSCRSGAGHGQHEGYGCLPLPNQLPLSECQKYQALGRLGSRPHNHQCATLLAVPLAEPPRKHLPLWFTSSFWPCLGSRTENILQKEV